MRKYAKEAVLPALESREDACRFVCTCTSTRKSAPQKGTHEEKEKEKEKERGRNERALHSGARVVRETDRPVFRAIATRWASRVLTSI